MLNNKYVNLYNAQYLGYFSLAPCYASRNIGNLFENFVWILEKYSKHVCLFVFLVEYFGCLIILCGLFDDSNVICFCFFFCIELTVRHY